MYGIVLDFELADKNILKMLGVFLDVNVQGYSFRPAKKNKPTKQALFGVQETCMELYGTVKVCITMSSKLLYQKK